MGLRAGARVCCSDVGLLARRDAADFFIYLTKYPPTPLEKQRTVGKMARLTLLLSSALASDDRGDVRAETKLFLNVFTSVSLSQLFL